MKKLTKLFTILSAIVLGFATAAPAFAQQGNYTVVVSDDGGPLPGANVMQQGTTNGAMTDIDGLALISGLKEGDVLEISFIGYVTQTVKVGKNTKITVVLKTDTTELDETIVVGYGVQKKESLTAAISQIRSEDITNNKGTDALVSLQGKVPGLMINDLGGKPGAFNTTLSLRGYGTPMIVVDGVVRSTQMTRKTSGWANSNKSLETYNDMSVLQEINPEDIESVSVLKDAAATIYGLGAKDGVILITTKKGRSQKPSVSYSLTARLQTPVTNRNVEDWVSFMKWDNAMADVAMINHRFTEQEIAAYAAGDPNYNYTDWYHVAAKDYWINTQHNFSIRGGSDKVSYYFGLGFADDDSIMKSDSFSYNKYNLNGSLTAQLTDALSLTYTTSMRLSNQNTLGNPDVDWNLQYYIYATDPRTGVHPVDNPNHWSEVNEHMNVGALLDPASSGISHMTNRSFNNTVDLKFDARKFLPGLTFTVTGAYDYAANKSRSLTLQYSTYDYLTDTYAASLRVENDYTELWTENQRLYARAQANYHKAIGKHDFSATLGAEVTNQQNARLMGSRRYGATADESFYTHDVLNQALATTADNDGTRSETATAGYIGRLSYNYSGKYLAELMGRYDGTYVYQKGKRWGLFPSYSLGWRASEESFIKDNIPALNNLKFRWSDGLTGSIQGGAYAYLGGYTQSGSWIFNPGAQTPGYNSTTVENTILTWADVRMMDFGIDWELWHGKFGGSFDWFKRKTSGTAATRTVSLPDFYGVSLPQENLNANENVGLELALNTAGHIGQFNYRAAASATFSRSRSTYIESEKDKIYNSSMSYWNSCSLNRWNGYHGGARYEWTGHQFQSLEETSALGVLYEASSSTRGNGEIVPGMYEFIDKDGNGYIDSNDQFYGWRGGSSPLSFGLNMSGSYKNFDFSLVFSGAALRSKTLGLSSYAGFGYLFQLPKMYTEDCWHVKEYGADPWDPNTEWESGYWPALSRVTQAGASHHATYTANQPYNYINSTFLRLKTLEVGYKFSPSLLRKAGIKSFRVYLNGGNLLTLCNKNLYFVDPETNDSGRQGGSFQLNRSYNLGVNLNF